MKNRLPNDCFALPPGVCWTPAEDALAHFQRRRGPVVDTEYCDIGSAQGRILAADVIAPRSHPPTSNAAVDGYGICGDGQSFALHPGRSAAGAPFTGQVPPAHALRILTGAAIPPGVDRIVLQEDVHVTQDTLTFYAKLKPGANIRSAGEDMVAGTAILPAQHMLTAADIGVLASVGVGRVQVYCPLKVAVISTGDEIKPTGQPASDHQIYDVNRPMLISMLRQWGMQVVDIGIVPDDRSHVRDALDRAADADVILTSGGASAGDEDHISALLNETGSMALWRIAVKPGRPLGLGVWNGVPVFALPGNPVAAFVCTCIFARPAMMQMAGGAFTQLKSFNLPAAFSKNKKPGRREYLRAHVNDQGQVEAFGSEGSGRISGLSWADGLVELGDDAAHIAPGDLVAYIPFSEFGL